MEQKIVNEKLAMDVYQSLPPKAFDMEGTIIKKNGKSITLEMELESNKFEVDIKLKDEITEDVGDDCKIEKENIVTYKKRPALGLEGAFEEEGARDIRKILEELGLPLNDDNVKLLEHFIKLGMTPNKENVSSFLMSREMLEDLRENLDMESIARLTSEGIDLERESLQKIAERIHALKALPEKKSIAEILGWKKEITTEEAETISQKIYGRKMGKDYYEAIKSLSKLNVEIDKDKVNKILSAHQKVYELKSVESDSFVSLEAKALDFNIENLYKEFKNYTLGSPNVNEFAKNFDNFTVVNNTELEGAEKLLSNIGIEANSENMEIVRAFILSDLEVTKDAVAKIIDMKKDFVKLSEVLDEDRTAYFIEKGFDPEKTEIPVLLDLAENDFEKREEPKSPNSQKSDMNSDTNITDKIHKKLEMDNPPSYKKLAEILKSGEDFTIDSLKDIEEPVILNENLSETEKAAVKITRLAKTFEKIGEVPRPEVISEAEKDKDISLNKLYEISEKTEVKGEVLINKVEATESFITKEYLRMKMSLSAQVVRISVAENVEIENMPLRKANDYIEKKLTFFQKIKNFQSETLSEKLLLPLIYKNGLELNIEEISGISQFLNGETGIGSAINNLKDFKKSKAKAEDLSREISDKIKNGEDFREEYKELLRTLSNPSESSRNKPYEEPAFLRTLKRISRGINTLQFPVEIGGEMNNLNVVMPKRKEKKSEINLFLSLKTEFSGNVEMNLTLRGSRVIIKESDIPENLKKYLPDYKAGLKEKGFELFVRTGQ